MSTGKTIFISDLHLQESNPNIIQLFYQLLQFAEHKQIDALYILGDLFEAWIGDDDLTPTHLEIINAMNKASEHFPVYFIKGNRDFLIGKKFQQLSGCQLLGDETVINLYNEFILLLHGDSLCVQDKNYLRWRRISRNKVLNTLLFLIWPLSIRRFLGKFFRQKSRQYNSQKKAEIMDVTTEAVIAIMNQYQTHTLIHGHTHKPNFHPIALGHVQGQRIVLAAWHEQGNMLMFDASGEKKLIYFKDNELVNFF